MEIVIRRTTMTTADRHHILIPKTWQPKQFIAWCILYLFWFYLMFFSSLLCYSFVVVCVQWIVLALLCNEILSFTQKKKSEQYFIKPRAPVSGNSCLECSCLEYRDSRFLFIYFFWSAVHRFSEIFSREKTYVGSNWRHSRVLGIYTKSRAFM